MAMESGMPVNRDQDRASWERFKGWRGALLVGALGLLWWVALVFSFACAVWVDLSISGMGFGSPLPPAPWWLWPYKLVVFCSVPLLVCALPVLRVGFGWRWFVVVGGVLLASTHFMAFMRIPGGEWIQGGVVFVVAPVLGVVVERWRSLLWPVVGVVLIVLVWGCVRVAPWCVRSSGCLP